ncbi:hypothetical protein BDZ88DRAFT_415543 [Geranomyces variabilis]|nr:hypothetical protein BDZ88DRAFT_415543 [Geranomyces variabilis]KAJ3137441.1 hypothetical protein HDU90_001842 [Geranomyces variabilis]
MDSHHQHHHHHHHDHDHDHHHHHDHSHAAAAATTTPLAALLAPYLPPQLASVLDLLANDSSHVRAFALTLAAAIPTLLAAVATSALLTRLSPATTPAAASCKEKPPAKAVKTQAIQSGTRQAFAAGVLLYISCFILAPVTNAALGARESMAWFFTSVLVLGFLDSLTTKATSKTPTSARAAGRILLLRASLLAFGAFFLGSLLTVTTTTATMSSLPLGRTVAGVAGLLAFVAVHELQPSAIPVVGKKMASVAVFAGMLVGFGVVEVLMGSVVAGTGHGH